MIAPVTTPKRRCAIYTRKSNEEGLDQEFTSLDAQRESGEAFIASQKHEGWVVQPDRYDDGGFSGSNLERPGLTRLMRDIEAGKIDVVIVYKVDRLSRSLLDFVNVLQVFDRHQVAFVSVTQQFNTATSMGRLILNILICFAQFERENSADRVRDKMAAARRKGRWVGGRPPLGYDVDYQLKKLVVNPEEAKVIRWIFTRYTQLRSACALVDELNAKGITLKTWTTKRGKHRVGLSFDRGNIYKILDNRTYIGEVFYRGAVYPGQQEAIVDRSLWDQVREIMSESGRVRGNRSRASVPGFLKGVARCAHCGSSMSMSWTKGGNGVLHRYYRCQAGAKKGADACPVAAVPAGDLETAVLAHLRQVFGSAPVVAAAGTAAVALAKESGFTLDHHGVLEAIRSINEVWDELFPAEQCRIVELLVARIEVGLDRSDLHLRLDGLQGLAADLQGKAGILVDAPDGEITIALPIHARRRCGRMRLLVPAAPESAIAVATKDPLAMSLARALRWQTELESGKVASVGALAKREGVDESFVRRHLRLTVLAPDVVRHILEGCGYGTASVANLTKQRFSDVWGEQVQAIGG